MIYFDNAATSFPKPKCVIDEVIRCLKLYCGNPGRSSHDMALAAAEKIYETRERLSDFVGADKAENIIFTPNATYALNLAIKGTVTEKCHCIISDIEHNSVIRPIYKCAEKYGCEISAFNTDLPLNKGLIPLIHSNTKIIATSIASNVTGHTLNITELSEISAKYNLKLIIDASQYLGHMPLNLKNVNYHVLCSAGHKALFGIQGSGFAIFKTSENIDTLIEGGSGIDTFSTRMPMLLPERYEAGTLFTPAIVSLWAGIGFINEVGINEIHSHINQLTERIKDILSSFKDITIYGAENGIISFNKANYPSSYIAELLNKKHIATRSGFHCAPKIHEKLGTQKRGAVRVSLSYMNSYNECDSLFRALRSIK